MASEHSRPGRLTWARGLVRSTAVMTAACLAAATALAAETTPRYVIYYNSDASPPETLLGTPYTDVILSFVTVVADAPRDKPIELAVPDKLTRALALVPRLRAEGKRVLVSFGGGDMGRDDYTAVADRTDALADALATFARRHGLDGIDIDFEVSEALRHERDAGLFDGRKFLIDLTKSLRRRLGEQARVTHAPQAPYLDPDWEGGPYLHVLREAGAQIDWISVQYYNNPAFDAPVAADIVGEGHAPRPTSYSGIVAGTGTLRWPAAKTLVGLPVYRDDAANGHLPPAEIGKNVLCPLVRRYGSDFGGLMGWQFSTLTADHRYWNTKMPRSLYGQACR